MSADGGWNIQGSRFSHTHFKSIAGILSSVISEALWGVCSWPPSSIDRCRRLLFLKAYVYVKGGPLGARLVHALGGCGDIRAIHRAPLSTEKKSYLWWLDVPFWKKGELCNNFGGTWSNEGTRKREGAYTPFISGLHSWKMARHRSPEVFTNCATHSEPFVVFLCQLSVRFEWSPFLTHPEIVTETTPLKVCLTKKRIFRFGRIKFGDLSGHPSSLKKSSYY